MVVFPVYFLHLAKFHVEYFSILYDEQSTNLEGICLIKTTLIRPNNPSKDTKVRTFDCEFLVALLLAALDCEHFSIFACFGETVFCTGLPN